MLRLPPIKVGDDLVPLEDLVRAYQILTTEGVLKALKTSQSLHEFPYRGIQVTVSLEGMDGKDVEMISESAQLDLFHELGGTTRCDSVDESQISAAVTLIKRIRGE